MKLLPKVVGLGLAAIALAPSPALALQGPQAHDVRDQIADLDRQPTPLAFWRGNMPLPGPLIDNRSSHFQGITRHPDPDARVMYVSASAGTGGTPTLAAVRIGSADGLGSSRLRSNRLADDKLLVTSPPFADDRVVWWKETSSIHPGGLQAAGDYLAVPYTSGPGDIGQGFIEIYDITDPVAPKLVDLDPTTPGSQNLEFAAGSDHTNVGGVGFVQLADGTYLLMAVAQFEKIHWFQTSGDDITTLSYSTSIDPPHDWPRRVDDYCSGVMENGDCTGTLAPPAVNPWNAGLWPDWFGSDGSFLTSLLSIVEAVIGEVLSDGQLYSTFQSFALVQDDNELFLAGMWNKTGLAPVLRGTDSLALYDVFFQTDENGKINFVDLGLQSTRSFDSSADDTVSIGGGTLSGDAYCGNFHAGSTVWVSPEGELLLYTIEHFAVGVFNYNALDQPLFQQDYIAFGEYHNPRDSSLPVTNATAHVALYSEQGFGGRRVEWTFADHMFESWDEFSTLPGPCAGFACNFANAVQSFSWRLPPGMTVRLFEDEFYSGDAIVLSGTGSVPLMFGFEDFIQDVASLQLSSPLAPDGAIVHGYTDATDRRQVFDFPSTSPLNLGAWKPQAIKLESGTYTAGDGGTTGTLLLEFPTQIRAVSGNVLLGR